MNRRQFVTRGGLFFTAPALVGCVGSRSTECVSSNDDLTTAICRQKKLHPDLTGRLSAGMIIGAAIGASVAIAFRFNPIVGIIGGAMAGGGLAAVDAYLQYLNDEAGGDNVKMAALAQADVHVDLEYSNYTLVDTRAIYGSTQQAFENRDNRLLENAERVKVARNALAVVQKNRKTFQTAHATYKAVSVKTELLKPIATQQEIDSMKYTIDNIEAEERRFFALAG